jgi:Flp pilus assembly protein TadB
MGMSKTSSPKRRVTKKSERTSISATEGGTAINARGDVNIGGTIHKEKGFFTEVNIGRSKNPQDSQKEKNTQPIKHPQLSNLFTFSILFLLILFAVAWLIVWVVQHLEQDVLLLTLVIILIVFLTVIVTLFMASKIISPNAGMTFFNNLIRKISPFALANKDTLKQDTIKKTPQR